MGKGDRRTKRGKIFCGTHGKFRPRKKVKQEQVEEVKQTEEVEQAEQVENAPEEQEPEAATEEEIGCVTGRALPPKALLFLSRRKTSMRVQCPQCGSSGNIPDEKIPATGRKIVCPKCNTSFFISTQRTSEPQTPEQRASMCYQQGVQLLKKNQIDAAIEQFTRALRVDPHYHQVYRHLGLAYGQKGLWQDAAQAFQKAILYKPDDAMALKNLGVAYLRQKHYEKAKEVLQQAVRHAPDDQKAHAFLAKALQHHKSKESSSEKTTSPATSDSEGTPPSSSPEASHSKFHNPVQDLLDQGVTCLDNAQYNKAIEAFQEAARLAPRNSDGYYGLGLVYEKREEWDKALSAYQKAVELNPDDSPARESLRFIKKQKRKSKFSWWKRKSD